MKICSIFFLPTKITPFKSAYLREKTPLSPPNGYYSKLPTATQRQFTSQPLTEINGKQIKLTVKSIFPFLQLWKEYRVSWITFTFP